MSNDKAVEEIKSTFEDFKEVNEQREKEIEEHGEALAETKEKMNKLQEKMDRIETKMERPELGGSESENSEEKQVFLKAMRQGTDNIDPDEKKELTVSDDTTGGYLAPNEYVQDIIDDVVEYSPVREVAKVRETSQRALEWPAKDGHLSAKWVGETESRDETTGTSWRLEEVPTHELEALVKISRQNLEDSVFDLESELRDEFSEQFGVAEGAAFVEGNAVKKPEGILENSDISNISSGSSGSIGADDLIDLFYEPKSDYADNGVFLLNRSTVKQIRKLKDSSGQYLWQPGMGGIDSSSPATILGRPYIECTDMPEVSDGNDAVVFGDFSSGYLIVDRTDMTVVRDPYSSKPLVEFEAYKRVGGQVVLPEAIKKLTISS